MVQLVPVTIQAPKELNDVRVALIQVVKDLKAGKSMSAILMNLSTFMEAIQGVDKIPTEAKEEMSKSVELAGLMGGQLLSVLMDKMIEV